MGLISVVLALATPALTQVGPIRGKVTDEQGRPVAEAAVETTRVSGIGFQREQRVAGRGQKWQARTDENGEYIISAPSSGIYLVTASKEGVGTDETQVAVEFGTLTTVNLTLSRAAPAPITEQQCAKSTAIKPFEEIIAANTGHPALARLLRWLEAVQLHTPGCSDSPVIDVGGWSPGDFETLLGDLMNLSAFLRWVSEKPLESSAEARSSIESLTGGSRRVSEVRFVRDPVRVAAILLYGRRFDLEEIEQIFHGNETLRRGAVLHADIAMFVPGDFSRYTLVQDGRRKSAHRGTVHWEIGRQLLDTITPSPSGDAGALLWYRAVSAYLFREGRLAEVAQHLNRARQVFPGHSVFLLDSAYLHQELSSPGIQAAVQELRADGADAAVDSRRNELQRAERFLREALSVAPDDAEGRLRLGHTLGELGRHQEAAAELRRAVDASPDRQQLYLAELFLGRQEQALGRRDEAKRRYENAAALFPNAQSPQLGLSYLARQSGDRTGALRALRSITAPVPSGVNHDDPWLDYYVPHSADAELLMQQMRKQLGSRDSR